MTDELLPQHGGYRSLRSFQMARLIYDLTLRFCDRFIAKRSRTHDQMVQAARSGTQNIAEGSQASGTSKKTEIKLTNVARASLEELVLDYEDYLRQNRGSVWGVRDPRRQDLVDRRLQTADDVARWVKGVCEDCGTPPGEVAANAVLVLLRVACSLLDRQIKAQADAFQREGGFTERLYWVRKKNRGF